MDGVWPPAPRQAHRRRLQSPPTGSPSEATSGGAARWRSATTATRCRHAFALSARPRRLTPRSTPELSIDSLLCLFEAVSRGTQSAVLGKDLHGRYVFANQAACALFGKQEADILGYTDGDLFPAKQAADIVRADRAVLAANKTIWKSNIKSE